MTALDNDGDDFDDVTREAQESDFERRLNRLDFLDDGQQRGQLEELLAECSVEKCKNLVPEKGTGLCDDCFELLAVEILTGKPRVRTYGPIPD